MMSSTSLMAQDSTAQWQNIYGGSDDDGISSIIRTSDGGFIMTGSTASSNGDVKYNHGGNDAWVVKLRNGGTIEWEKTYGGSNGEYGAQIVKTFDSCYVIIGATTSNDGDVKKNNGGLDVWIFKIDKRGKILWEYTYGGSNYDAGLGIANSPDSGFVVIARTESNDSDVKYNHGDYDVWVLKLNKNGILQWQKSFGSTGFDAPTSIAQVPEDSGYIISAIPGDSNGDVTKLYGYEDAWVFRIDKLGSLLWQNNFGNYSYDHFMSICRTLDSNYILVGSSGAIPNMSYLTDLWAIKININGTKLWNRFFGGTRREGANTVIASTDSGCLITGYTKSHNGDVKGYFDPIGQAMWTLKLDAAGILIWQRVDGGIDFDMEGNSTSISNDSGYIVGGTNTAGDIVLVKINGHWKPVQIQVKSGCLPRQVNLSTNYPIAREDSLLTEWDFGDGKGYVNGNDTVSMVINNSGSYTIFLRITNNRYDYRGSVLSEDSLNFEVKGFVPTTPTIILKGKDTLLTYSGGDSCEWYLDSVFIAKGACQIMPVKSGKYQVISDSGGCPSYLSKSFYFNFVNVEMNENVNKRVILFPNPVQSHLQLKIEDESLSDHQSKISISDITGRTVLTQSVFASEISINISNLTNGIYTIHYTNSNIIWNGNFVKQ